MATLPDSAVDERGQENDVQVSVDRERRDFEAAGNLQRVAVGRIELAGGFLMLAVWFLLFAGGILIGTEPYVTALATGLVADNLYWVASFVAIVILFWTITNVGMLACLAAVLGAFGRRTRFTARVVSHDFDTARDMVSESPVYPASLHYASAVIRGFGVYVLVLSGLLVLATDLIVSPTQGQYVRMAALVSVVSFYAGYDPAMFGGLLERIKRFLQK